MKHRIRIVCHWVHLRFHIEFFTKGKHQIWQFYSQPLQISNIHWFIQIHLQYLNCKIPKHFISDRLPYCEKPEYNELTRICSHLPFLLTPPFVLSLLCVGFVQSEKNLQDPVKHYWRIVKAFSVFHSQSPLSSFPVIHQVGNIGILYNF